MACGNSLESNFISMKHAVEFLDVQDQYYCNEDFICTIKFNDYTPLEGDRIAIFKLGWSFVKDYVLFEWAPIGIHQNPCIITFNKHILPKKNFEEMYQICYISGDNELHGASSPFQFSQEKPGTAAEVLGESVYKSLSKSKLPDFKIHDNNNSEIIKLKEENEILKQALKVALSHKDKSYDADIEELKQQMGTMKQELDMLKTKLLDSKEEYKKLYLEKYKIEKKYDNLINKGKEIKPINNKTEFDISKLESIPPFPLLIKKEDY